MRRLLLALLLAIPLTDDLPLDDKIVGLSRFWSEVKFNFANFDVAKPDWDALYRAYLPRVRESKSTLEYYLLLQEMCAQLHDAHTNVILPPALRDRVNAFPAIDTRLIDGHVLITNVYADAGKDVRAGDEITAIDDVPAKEYAARFITPYQSASTPQDLDERVYNYALLGGDVEKPVKLTIARADGKNLGKSFARVARAERRKFVPPVHLFELTMLPGNIAHVKLNTFGEAAAADAFEKQLDTILAARAVVLDVRENGGGNSSVGYRILSHFIDKPEVVLRWETRQYRPLFRAWQKPQEPYGEAVTIKPAEGKHFTGPVALLIGSKTFSAAEDFAVAFDVVPGGIIVGEPTAGSTGQPLYFDLPGGGSARVCTKHDRYPDGREFVGVGVKPGIDVVRRWPTFGPVAIPCWRARWPS